MAIRHPVWSIEGPSTVKRRLRPLVDHSRISGRDDQYQGAIEDLVGRCGAFKTVNRPAKIVRI
jgi:hypothetical protein